MNRIFASLALLCLLTNSVSAKEINSKEEYAKVLRNAQELTANKTPKVERWGEYTSDEWSGDGFDFVINKKNGIITGTFVCINDTDTAQTCWMDDGKEYKRHSGPGYAAGEWSFDGPDGNVHFIRKRWPGEPAPDLFK